MRTRLSADWVVGHDAGRHCLIEHGEIVYQDDRIIFVGHDFPGEVDASHACGKALIAPGFIDLDALADLDTTILGFDNQPGWRKGRVWPQSYMDRGPVEMYSVEELAFQKRYAFAQLLRNGITTALPIASLFYREWGETAEEFADAADIAAGTRAAGLSRPLLSQRQPGGGCVRDNRCVFRRGAWIVRTEIGHRLL